MSRLPTLRPAFKDIAIYETKAKFFLIGYNDVSETFQILEVNRPVMCVEEEVSLRQDPQIYTKDTLAARVAFLQQHFPGMELVASGVSCLWGFVKLLESHYLIYVTAKHKVGNILGHELYGVEKTQMLCVTYKVRSSPEEAKYKSILGAMELNKFFYFSYSYDLTRSYQRNVTDPKSSHVTCQDMFTWNSYAIKSLVAHANATTESAVAASISGWMVPIIYGFLDQRSFRFSCGSVVQFTLIARRSRFFAGTRYLRRGVNGEGHVANEVESEQLFTLSESANAMQGPSGGRGSSLVQCRGSVPLFWSHVNLYSPKPDFRLEGGDADYAASKAHFQSLFDRYGRRVQCFNLVRHSPHKEELLGTAFRELCPIVNKILGPTECFGHSNENAGAKCDQCSHLPNGAGEGVSYLEYDFLKNAHAKPNEPSHLFSDLEARCEDFFHKFGFYIDPPSGSNVYLSFPCVDTGPEVGGKFRELCKKDREQPVRSNICNRISEEEARMLLAATDIVEETADLDVSQSKQSTQENSSSNIFLLSNGLNCAAEVSSNTYGAGASTGLLQYGTLRTNCVDCLDRTNVAQFCYARVAISRQLKALGFLPTPKALGDMITACMKLWAEHGDAIATQYGGSGAMHKVDAEEAAGGGSTGDSDQPQDTVFVLTGGAKNALVAAQRYYSNIRSDYERQNSIDMLLGVFKPHYKEKHIWELKLRPENIRHGKYGRRSSDLSGLLAAGKELAASAPNSALEKLKQLSTKHFTDDDEASSGEDEGEEEPSRETELRSHIEHHKNEKASVNVIRLAIAEKRLIALELPSCELTSFDSTLRREYGALALDGLPFLPFPMIETEWKPSVYLAAEENSHSGLTGNAPSDEQVFKKLEERVYGLYLEYYTGGLLDESKPNFSVVLRSLLESTVDTPLDGMSMPKCQIDQLLSLSEREKELLTLNRVDPKLMHAFMALTPALQAQAPRDWLGGESKTNIRRAPETPSDGLNANETVRKWEEKQKLKEIFDPFSLSTFPELSEKQSKKASQLTDQKDMQENRETKPDGSAPVLADGATVTPIGESAPSQATADRQSISGSAGEAKASASNKSSKSKPKWQFWNSDKKKGTDQVVEVAPSAPGTIAPAPPTAEMPPPVPQAMAAEKATGRSGGAPAPVPKPKDKLKDIPKKSNAPTGAVNEAATTERITVAVEQIMKTKMNEYEVENLKLKMALHCMQRKIDDMCSLGFVQQQDS